MSTPRFDLSAFRGGSSREVDVPPPPARPQPEEPEAPSDVQPKRARGGGRAAKPKVEQPKADQPKVRVTANVPAAVARQAKERAAHEELYLTDLLLSAYANHHEAVRSDVDARVVALPGLPPRARRHRRSVADPTQFVLYVSRQELDVLDDLAQALGISRSELVTRLLEAELND